jgi:hypothetical protein
MPKLSVPSEVDKGSSSDAPHRHTDVHQGIAGVTPGLTTLEKRPLPFRGKILIGRNNLGPSFSRKFFEFLRILLCKGYFAAKHGQQKDRY